MPSAAVRATCLHCGGPSIRTFCCSGCESVYTFLDEAGLLGYYDVRQGRGVPATSAGAVADEHADRKWLDAVPRGESLSRIDLDLQGVHCSACVWLIEAVFRRQGGSAIVVNPAVGRVELTVDRAFDLPRWVADVERLGYRLGPASDRKSAVLASDVMWRMGVSIALAVNAMIFAVAIYCGLDSGDTYRLFQRIAFGVSTASVIVGGPIFFRSAAQAVRQRTLHLDVPIALGILLAYGSSAYTYFARGGATSFFDTISVFIALMLVGRHLQERVVVKNRASILASSGVEHLLTRRLGKEVATVRCTEIRSGDRLLIARGDLVPVDACVDRVAPFSLDWINGESTRKTFAPGDVIPAGAFSCGDQAVTVTAKSDFEASSLASLLRTTRTREKDLARATPFWSKLTRIYVAAVLVLAVAAFGGWFVATRDLPRTLDVVAALLIVTCPCAFGIATPLAYELASAGLRRRGLFVRSPAFLDRACDVRKVIFDKTGTLTTGALRVTNGAAIDALAPEHRAVLFDMVNRSSHPKSQALAKAMTGTVREGSSSVIERVGRGLELTCDGRVYRLGSPAWTAAIGPGDVAFTCDGEFLASFATSEELRPDAAMEVAALERDGFVVSILSGDTPLRVGQVASRCGISSARVFGGKSPQGKAKFVAAFDRGDVLFLGDGINDALVADVATCSGTPAIDRPFMAARTDFYVVTPGLSPIRLALEVARRVRRVVHLNIAIAAIYNLVTVGLALAGHMSPLLCAVLMPLASLTTVFATTASLSPRNRLWKS